MYFVCAIATRGYMQNKLTKEIWRPWSSAVMLR